MKNRLVMLVILLACMLASTVACIWMLGCIIVGSQRAWRIALAFDQVLNATSGGDGRETVSSRAGRAELVKRRWGCILCKLLDVIDKNHCFDNIIQEYLSMQERVVFNLRGGAKPSD